MEYNHNDLQLYIDEYNHNDLQLYTNIACGDILVSKG